MKRLLLGLVIWSMAGVTGAQAFAGKKSSHPEIAPLVPHRAVYELKLANKKQAVTVADVRGRMVFEVTGSACDGYTQNMRMVTRITDEKGKQTLSDIRSSTWEQIGRAKKAGREKPKKAKKASRGRFRFTSSQYYDRSLLEVVAGAASRDRQTNNIVIKIKKPEKSELELPSDVLFPTEHSLALLAAAKAGKNHLNVRIYDGSEQGQKFYQTFSYIGKMNPPKTAGNGRLSAKPHGLARFGLATLPSWPVAISYFDGEGGGYDKAPSYELSFLLYLNGVSTNLLINYGEFSVRGHLNKIKYLRRRDCDRK